MREHLRIRDLADRRDGRLGAAALAAAEAHLATGCAACTAAAARVDDTISLLREGPLAAPPARVTRGAVRMFRARKWASLLAVPGRLIAQLVLDQRMDVVPALRSAAGSTRRTLWNVGEHELDACLVERANDADLIGQLLPADDDGAAEVVGEVTAMCDGRVLATTPFDSDGRFEFLRLPHGTYALTGRVNGSDFVLAPLGVGEDV
jgi:hypothetical protein